MICGKCGQQADPCGVISEGAPMCWHCYNVRLDEILAMLPVLEPTRVKIAPPLPVIAREKLPTLPIIQHNSGQLGAGS